MSRDLTAAMIAAVQAGTVRPVLLFYAVFAGGTLRLWSGTGTLTWGGHDWVGAGGLIGVSVVEESDEIKNRGVAVSLSGIPADYVALIFDDAQTGQSGTIYLALLDATGAVLADPVVLFTGVMDVPGMEDGGDTATISISYEDRLVTLQRSRERRLTHEDQQIDFPGDLGREYVASIQGVPLVWGRS